jgi:hypothetical protein
MIFLQKRTLEFMDKEIGNLRCCKDEILKANSNRFDSPTSAHYKGDRRIRISAIFGISLDSDKGSYCV